MFGNIFKNISICEDHIKHLQFQLDKEGVYDNLNLLLDQSREQYENFLRQEEILWRQKSRIKWLVEEDKNTKFFKQTIKATRLKYDTKDFYLP